jgi:RNA polymerase sigma-70 factor (ECF subfamily)
MGESHPDTLLVARSRKGDGEAFSDLVRRHQSALLSTARHLLGDGEAAREAAQESFLRAWSSLDAYSGRGSFRAWLFSILRNLCTDVWRTRARSGHPEPVPEAGAPHRGEQRLLRLEQRVALHAVEEALTPRQWLALRLAAAEDCSAAELAAALGCAVPTARVTLFQARRKALRVLEVHMEGLGVSKEKTRATLLGV